VTTVRLEDVVRDPSGLRRTGPVTTAHYHVARFYLEACRCKEPGCGIQFAYVPGLTESRDCCYFCSQRKRRERLAAERAPETAPEDPEAVR
jgi:hypothetical protein